MKIRKFSREDLPSIVAIQKMCLAATSWLEADYARLADDSGGMILVAEFETMTPPKVLGFAAFSRVMDEAELMNLAVDPAHRRQGIGRALIEEAGKRLVQAGVKRVFLEVRPSNKPALALYYSLGFAMQSLRKDYYRDPNEDALVLCRELFPSPR